MRVITDRPKYARGLCIWFTGRVAYIHMNMWSLEKPRLKFVPSEPLE